MGHDPRMAAHCPRCGQIELAPEQIWLVLTNVPGRAHYNFRCPSCATYVRRPADADTVAILALLVPVEELEIPAEALEPREGSTLTVDDLIDLMVNLADCDAPAEYASAGYG